MTAEVINVFSPEVLKAILFIQSNSFPKEWEFDDAEEYFKGMLDTHKNINILLSDNGKKIGHLLAIPHNDAVRDLQNDDPELREDPSKYYIEIVGILPEFRGKGGLSKMLDKLINECKKREIKKISMHARVNNRFSVIIQSKFRINEIRRIENWKYYNHEEPTDYIEVIID